MGEGGGGLGFALQPIAHDQHRFDVARGHLIFNGSLEHQAIAAPDSDGWQQFAISVKDGSMIGDLDIRFSPPWNATAELGFALDPRWQRQGLCAEAVEAMVRRLFRNGRRRLVAVTDARNRPAQRVLERCWFREEGRFVQSWRDGDAWFDEVSYARLASD